MKTLNISVCESKSGLTQWFYIYSVMCQSGDGSIFEYASYLSEECANKRCESCRQHLTDFDDSIFWVDKFQVFAR